MKLDQSCGDTALLKQGCVSTRKSDPYQRSQGAILRDDGLGLDGAFHNPKWSFRARLGSEQRGGSVSAPRSLLKFTRAQAALGVQQ